MIHVIVTLLILFSRNRHLFVIFLTSFARQIHSFKKNSSLFSVTAVSLQKKLVVIPSFSRFITIDLLKMQSSRINYLIKYE